MAFCALLFSFYFLFFCKNFSRYSVLTESLCLSFVGFDAFEGITAMHQMVRYIVLPALHCISISFLFHCCTSQQRLDMCSTIRSNFSRTEHERRFNKLAFVRLWPPLPFIPPSDLFCSDVSRSEEKTHTLIDSYTLAKAHTHNTQNERNTLRRAQH